MIRARLSDGTFILGIDAENVRRLKSGQPIRVDLKQLGGTDVVAIVYGDTLDEITRELERASGQSLTPGEKGQP